MEKIEKYSVENLFHSQVCPDCEPEYPEHRHDATASIDNFYNVAIQIHGRNTCMLYSLCKKCDNAFRISLRGLETQPREISEYEIRITPSVNWMENNRCLAVRVWRIKKKTFEKHQRQQQDEKLLSRAKSILLPDYLFEID